MQSSSSKSEEFQGLQDQISKMHFNGFLIMIRLDNQYEKHDQNVNWYNCYLISKNKVLLRFPLVPSCILYNEGDKEERSTIEQYVLDALNTAHQSSVCDCCFLSFFCVFGFFNGGVLGVLGVFHLCGLDLEIKDFVDE